MPVPEPLITQWLLAKGLVWEEAALHELQSLVNNEGAVEEDMMSSIFANIRESLRPYHLELRRIYSFDSHKPFWIVYNTLGDSIAQMATQYSPEQLRFIASSSKYQASTIDALLQANGLLSKKQCEDFIDSLIAGHWLIKSISGKLMIGPRTSVELEVYLKEEELFDLCAVCRALVTTKVQPTIGSDTHVAKNVKCSNPECDSRVHDVCYERMVKANSEFRCQECRTGIFN